MVGSHPVEPGRPPPEPHMLACLLRGAHTRRCPTKGRCIAMARGMGADHTYHDRDIGIILRRRGYEWAAWWLKRYLRANPDTYDIGQVADLIASLGRR